MGKKYGLIGCPLGHSVSPMIHARIGEYDYKLNELKKDELEAFMKEKPLDGFNVTIPYKIDVIPYLDEISESAKRIGAVNTVAKKEDGRLYGDNTDYYGLKELIDHSEIAIKDSCILILGTGGASLMAQTLVNDMGASDVIVASRSKRENSDIARFITYDEIKNHKEIEVVINATPVGMHPKVDDIPINLDDVPNCRGVIDIVANPIRTRLVLEASERGIKAEGGLRMLVAQAVKAAQIFREITGDENMILHPDAMDISAASYRIMKELKKEVSNIVFVGMPGSGKTTSSGVMHKLTNMPAIDTDDMIVNEEGKSIPEIFEEKGESGFREIERRVVAKASLNRGHIIATGGGAILSEENRRHLRNNGYVIYLDAPIEILATEGRPLSKNREALESMKKFREPLYKKTADITVKIDENYEECLNKIKEVLCDFFE